MYRRRGSDGGPSGRSQHIRRLPAPTCFTPHCREQEREHTKKRSRRTICIPANKKWHRCVAYPLDSQSELHVKLSFQIDPGSWVVPTQAFRYAFAYSSVNRRIGTSSSDNQSQELKISRHHPRWSSRLRSGPSKHVHYLHPRFTWSEIPRDRLTQSTPPRV